MIVLIERILSIWVLISALNCSILSWVLIGGMLDSGSVLSCWNVIVGALNICKFSWEVIRVLLNDGSVLS